ncbi:MAG: universal stress protein [Stenotrophomonas sp.]
MHAVTADTATAPHSLLLATDLDARCDRAMERAIALARHWQARLVVVCVLPPREQHELSEQLFGQADWGPSLSPQAAARRRLQRDLGSLAEGVTLCLRLEHGTPGSTVLRVAREEGCGLIITGLAANAAFQQPRLGSTVSWLARHSEVPLLLVRNRAHRPYRSMVLANDHSPHCQHALHTALELFGEPLQLSLVHALELPRAGLLTTPLAELQAQARQAASQRDRQFLDSCTFSSALRQRITLASDDGEPARVLGRYVRDHDSDLMIVASHGRSAVSELLLGSDAQRLLAQAATDTLLVRRPLDMPGKAE